MMPMTCPSDELQLLLLRLLLLLLLQLLLQLLSPASRGRAKP